jgi:hypothetical protein
MALCNTKAFAIRLPRGLRNLECFRNTPVAKYQSSGTGQEYMPAPKIKTPD